MAEVEVALKGNGASSRGVDPHEQEVLSELIGCVRKAGAEDRCRIEVELAREGDDDGPPTVLTLIPSNPSAAALGVQLDHDAQITFYLGRHQSVAEDFNRDRAELLHTVGYFAQVVLAGEYREYVKPHAVRHRAIGKFKGPGDRKTRTLTYNVLLPRRWSSLASKGWTEETYQPY
jgi:hypothetical protein